jgi:hypothetical protein
MAKERFEIPSFGIGLAYRILKRILCQMEPHGQSPCLHAGVPAFDEALRAARCFGTQAWSPAAGMKIQIPNPFPF